MSVSKKIKKINRVNAVNDKFVNWCKREYKGEYG